MEDIIKEIKQAFKEYVKSEGCSCCRDIDAHKLASDKLGKLLNAKEYEDGSGYDWHSED